MDLCNRNDIQALLQRHGFHFSKAMGQNFLIQGWVPRDIAAACGADEHTGVLEIGPGIGPLTRELAQRAGKVVSVELDRRLYPVLEETMADFPNFTLIRGDVMQQELPALVREHLGGLRPILCANLPYNITTPLLTRVVESRCFQSLTVLIQKEVAQRICAAPGTADYGAFTLLMQYYTAPELLFEVPNTCFLPAPKVTSAVIHCPVRKQPPVEVGSEAMLWRTVRAGFALRRKTLVNSLQTGFPLPKDRLAAIVSACGLPENVRGERLSLRIMPPWPTRWPGRRRHEAPVAAAAFAAGRGCVKIGPPAARGAVPGPWVVRSAVTESWPLAHRHPSALRRPLEASFSPVASAQRSRSTATDPGGQTRSDTTYQTCSAAPTHNRSCPPRQTPPSDTSAKRNTSSTT